ncbi:MAG: exo-alpha-sialidase [Armatimonadetes bacterium]|nr:exo-alpha-sialidase [Armatimonadota bacterium]
MTSGAAVRVFREVEAERIVVAQGPGCGYFPVVVNPGGDELIAVIRGGAGHIGVGGRLDLVRSEDGGKTWSTPRTAVGTSQDDRNPALGWTAGGSLILAYGSLTGYYKAYAGHKGTPDYQFSDHLTDVWVPELSAFTCFFAISRDRGESWSPPKELALAGYENVSPYGRIVEMPDRTLWMNVYGTKKGGPEGKYEAFVIRSRDGGESWGDPSLIGKGLNETSFLLLPDERILSAARSDAPEEAVHALVSSDGGYAWESLGKVTETLEHPADLALLGDGRVFLVYGSRNFPYGARALVSEDRGETWKRQSTILLADDADSRDCGYPSAVRLEDGTLVTVLYMEGSCRHLDLGTHCAAVRLREDLIQARPC